MKRVKSLFIAASIIAVVIGSIQIAGNVIDFGGSEPAKTKTAQAPATDADRIETAAPAHPAGGAGQPRRQSAASAPQLSGIRAVRAADRQHLSPPRRRSI